jgi:hypothetical protein
VKSFASQFRDNSYRHTHVLEACQFQNNGPPSVIKPVIHAP